MIKKQLFTAAYTWVEFATILSILFGMYFSSVYLVQAAILAVIAIMANNIRNDEKEGFFTSRSNNLFDLMVLIGVSLLFVNGMFIVGVIALLTGSLISVAADSKN